MFTTVCGLPISLSAIGDMLSGLGAIAGPIALYFAAKIGAGTFEDWKQQRIFEKKAELAEAALALAYKLRDAIEVIRSEGYFETEVDYAKKVLLEQGISSEDTSDGRAVTSQIILNRINNYVDIIDELNALRPSILVILGKEVEGEMAVFRWAVKEIRIAAKYYARKIRPPRTEQQQEELERRLLRYESTFWSRGDIDENGFPIKDKIDKNISGAIEKLEEEFSHYLGRKQKRRGLQFGFCKGRAVGAAVR